MFPSRRRLILGRRRQVESRHNRRMVSIWSRSCLAYQECLQPAADVDPPSANMSPARVEPPTRGAQQIIKENAQTMRTYKYLVVGATGFRFLIGPIALILTTDVWELLAPIALMNITCTSYFLMPALILAWFSVMNKMSKPIYSDTNEKTLIFAGFDFNIKSVAAEHFKEILLVLVLTHLLTMIDNIFFVALAILPFRALYLFYVRSAEPFFGMHPEEARRGVKLILQNTLHDACRNFYLHILLFIYLIILLSVLSFFLITIVFFFGQ